MKPLKSFKSEFFRSVVVVASGAVIAQLIGLALAPVITRLYTPEQMGEFGFFLRVITLISTVATARYELSLPLPHSDRNSFHLFRLALRMTLYTTAVVLIGSFIYMGFQGFRTDAVFIGLSIVLGAFLLVFFNLGTNWAIRIKAFNSISFSKISSSLSLNGLRVLLGVFQPGTYTLILTYLMSLVIGSYYFFIEFLKSNKQLQPISRKRMAALSRIYSDFPRVSLPHALMEAARDLIIAVIVVEVFSDFLFGSYDHSMKMLRMPLILIGASVSQVFFNRVSELKNKKEPILPLVRKTIRSLTLLSLVPFTLIFFFGEPLFAWVFGEEWRVSGYLSEIMAPWLMVNFVSSPLSALPLVLGKQKRFFLIGLASTILFLIGFGIIPLLGEAGRTDIEWVFGFVTVSQLLISLYAIVFIVKISKESDDALNV